MLSSTSPVPALVRATHQALDWHRYDDACFLAERIHAEGPDEKTLHLLATVYFRAGQISRAYSVLRGATSTECRFLFAKICLELDKLQEAELALTNQMSSSTSAFPAGMADTHGAAEQLLGDVFRKAGRFGQAKACYRKAIQVNPYCWGAFNALCQLGEAIDIDTVFTAAKASQAVPQTDLPDNDDWIAPPSSAYVPSPARLRKASRIDDALRREVQVRSTLQFDDSMSKDTPLKPQDNFGASTPMDTPLNAPGTFALPGSPSGAATFSSLGTPLPSTLLAESTMRRALASSSLRKPSDASISVTPADAGTREMASTGRSLRRSTRLQKTGHPPVNAPQKKTRSRVGSTDSEATTTSTSTTASVSVKRHSRTSRTRTRGQDTENAPSVRPGTAVDANTQQPQLSQIVSKDATKDSHVAAMALMSVLAKATSALARFECSKVVQILEDLTPQQANTGMVQCLIGRAYFELGHYKAADVAFRLARRVEAHRVAGMEVYSTVLWHLRQSTSLAYLAHEVMAANRLCPEAWCVVGNCFSLQKDHELAIKYFERAVQLDSSFSYAFTMLGHEYTATEEYDKAMSCFRNALRHEPAHYKAWYGMGIVYLKQEKYDLAEIHFQKAISINSNSPVLFCYLGIAQHARGRSEEALQCLEKAATIDPNNPLVMFRRAIILYNLSRYEECLALLEKLKTLAPRETNVYYLMGKVYEKLKQFDKALLAQSWMRDLGSKEATKLLKEVIDSTRDVADQDTSLGGAEPAESPIGNVTPGEASREEHDMGDHGEMDDSADIDAPMMDDRRESMQSEADELQLPPRSPVDRYSPARAQEMRARAVNALARQLFEASGRVSPSSASTIPSPPAPGSPDSDRMDESDLSDYMS